MEKILKNAVSDGFGKIITRRPDGSIRVQTVNEQPSMTDQQHVDEVDVNNIMERFTKTGQLPHLSNKQGIYADVSDVPDLLNASIIVKEAEMKFNSLPSSVREKFQNNPIAMMDYLKNPSNMEEAVKLGLVTRKEVSQNDDLNDDTQTSKQKSAPKKTATPPPDNSGE